MKPGSGIERNLGRTLSRGHPKSEGLCGRSSQRLAALMAAVLVLVPAAALAGPLDQAKAGLDALDKGDNAAAIRLFTQALASKQLAKADRELAYVKRGEAYLAAGDKDKALADAKRALALEPKDEEARTLRQKTETETAAASPSPPVAPVPAAAPASGPSLDETLDFIVQQLNRVGPVNFASYFHDSADNSDWSIQWSEQNSPVNYNSTTCNISFHHKRLRNNDVNLDQDEGFVLKDVSKFVLEPEEQEFLRGDAAEGHPTRRSQVSPPVFDIHVLRTDGKQNYLYFTDEDQANRVLRALTHAMELCGGGKSLF